MLKQTADVNLMQGLVKSLKRSWRLRLPEQTAERGRRDLQITFIGLLLEPNVFIQTKILSNLFKGKGQQEVIQTGCSFSLPAAP